MSWLGRVLDRVLGILGWFEAIDERHLFRDVAIRSAVAAFGIVSFFSVQDAWDERQFQAQPDITATVTDVRESRSGDPECAGKIYTVDATGASATGTLDDCDYSHDVGDTFTVRIGKDGKLAEDVTPYADYLYIIPMLTAAGSVLFTLIFFVVFGIRIGLVVPFDRGGSPGRRKRK